MSNFNVLIQQFIVWIDQTFNVFKRRTVNGLFLQHFHIVGVGCLMPVCQQYFSYIMAVSFIGGVNRELIENHLPATSH